MVPGDTVEIDVAAKGGGSENKSKFKMMNPSDNIVDWVVEQIPSMGCNIKWKSGQEPDYFPG